MKKYENEFHGNYYQGRSQKQYEGSGKLYLFSIIGMVVLILIELYINF